MILAEQQARNFSRYGDGSRSINSLVAGKKDLSHGAAEANSRGSNLQSQPRGYQEQTIECRNVFRSGGPWLLMQASHARYRAPPRKFIGANECNRRVFPSCTVPSLPWTLNVEPRVPFQSIAIICPGRRDAHKAGKTRPLLQCKSNVSTREILMVAIKVAIRLVSGR